MTVWRIAITAVLAGLVAMLVASIVWAHSWYDPYCCNDKDCRPISSTAEGWSEVELTSVGYVWTSSRSGIRHIIPHGDERIRPSRDGDYHACELPDSPLGYEYARCLYVPMIF